MTNKIKTNDKRQGIGIFYEKYRTWIFCPNQKQIIRHYVQNYVEILIRDMLTSCENFIILDQNIPVEIEFEKCKVKFASQYIFVNK